MKNKGRAYINTIGCQMNVYDSEKLAAILNAYGYEKTGQMDKADIIVCNTCSIRHKAEEKAFSFLGRLAELKKRKPGLITVMAGCVAQQEGEKAFSRVPHLDIVLGTQAFSRFGSHLEAVHGGRSRIVDTEDASAIYESLPDPSGFEENQISRFVTIMQGCDNFCTYCVVPYTRGRERSRKAESIVEEVSILADTGVKEVTLLGQNVNSYGEKESDISFARLLEKISEVPGIRRIRFATSHPKDLSLALIKTIRDIDKVCNHLHLPVQSGSSRILKKMNRGYTREVYLEKIERLREHCPGIALSTDIIVGFPKESDADFEQTMALLRAVEFDSIFAFAYSDRSSAPAAKFPDQVDEAVKRERLNRLLALQETYTEKKNQQLVGEIVELLVEGRSQKQREGLTLSGGAGVQMFGRTGGNKIVHFPSENVNIGDVLEIKIENAYPHSLWGLPVEPETK